MNHFIKLTSTVDKSTHWINPDSITAMNVPTIPKSSIQGTMVYFNDGFAFSVFETPREIDDLMNEHYEKQMERVNERMI